MKILVKYILPAVLIAGVAIWIWVWLTGKEKERDDGIELREARIKSIAEILELCTLDICEEVAIKDSIHGKWIVASQKIEGRVRFDLDSLKVETRGDTLYVILPKARVDIFESADSNSYRVLDSWEQGRPALFARPMTAAEENVLKQRWREKMRRRIYSRGYVENATEDAKKTLRSLLEAGGSRIVFVEPLPSVRTIE